MLFKNKSLMAKRAFKFSKNAALEFEVPVQITTRDVRSSAFHAAVNFIHTVGKRRVDRAVTYKISHYVSASF